MPKSVPMSWLYILTACFRVSSSFWFFTNSFMSSIYFRWLIISCDLLSLYLAVHFLSMWVRGIIAVMNSNVDSASPWNIPLWIFVSAKVLPPAVNSIFQVFMVFLIKFMTSSYTLYILREFIIQLCGTIWYEFLLSIQSIARFFRLLLVLLLFSMCWSKYPCCTPGSLTASFLFLSEQPVACWRIVNFFPHFCCWYFPHHR